MQDLRHSDSTTSCFVKRIGAYREYNEGDTPHPLTQMLESHYSLLGRVRTATFGASVLGKVLCLEKE